MGKYQAYPEYKDSGVEWMGKIPAHWDKKRIKETASLINGYPFDSKMFEAGQGMPLVRIRDIRSSSTEVRFVGDVPKSALINNGDLLVGMDGDFNVAIWNGGLAALNQRVACVRASNHHLHKLIFYTLPFNMKVVNDLTYFTTVKHLSSVDILKSVYPFPPENELTKIVSFLDHETAKIDTLIDKQQQLIQLLKEKRQAVISHAVTKGLNPNAPMRDSGVEWLGEVPEHWVLARLKNVLRIRNGRDYKDVEVEEGGYPVYGSGGIFKRSSSYLYDGKSVLFGRKGTIDKPLVVSGKFWTVDTMFYSEVFDNVLPEYIYYQATFFPFNLLSTNTALPSMTQEDLLMLPFVVPPRIEQEGIIKYVQDKSARFDNLIGKAQSAIELMQERRTALISAAVTGKIDVRHHVSRPAGNDTIG